MNITYFNHNGQSAKRARMALILVVILFSISLSLSAFYEPGFRSIRTSIGFFILFIIFGALNLYVVAPLLSRRVGIIVFLILMICSASLTCFSVLFLFDRHIIDYPDFVQADLIPKRMLVAMYLCFGLVIFFSGRFIYLFFNTFQLSNDKVKNELESYNNEINSLRLQVNPNFLNSSLETIKRLLEENRVEDALKFNTETYHLLEKQIKYAQKETIRLEEDIKWIEHYLKTQQLVEGKQFEYQINVADSELYLQEIPPILLQPILEKYISMLKDVEAVHKIMINVEDVASDLGNGIKVELTDRFEIEKKVEMKHYGLLTHLEKRIEIINKAGKFNISIDSKYDVSSILFTLVIIEINAK